MKRPTFTITDVKGDEGQKRLDHYNRWLLDPKREAGTTYPGYPEDRKVKSRKKGRIMEQVAVDTGVMKNVVKTVKAVKAPKAPREGTKLSKAIVIVKDTGKDDKEACLKALVEALAITRGNASIYYAKAIAALA